MTRAFETGTIVELNSGGPAMTVSDQYTNGDIIAVYWFDSNSVLRRDAFHKDCLFSPVQRRMERMERWNHGEWKHDGDFTSFMESTK